MGVQCPGLQSEVPVLPDRVEDLLKSSRLPLDHSVFLYQGVANPFATDRNTWLLGWGLFEPI